MLELIILAHVASDTFDRTPFNVGQRPVALVDQSSIESWAQLREVGSGLERLGIAALIPY